MSGGSWNPPERPYGGGAYRQEPQESRSSLVRMYTVTGGRTAPRMQLAMEALVSSATSIQLGLNYSREDRAISQLCLQVRSVAEISALLSMPLGVARVLVADMANEGLVRVYQPQLETSGKPNRDLLERVLTGLRKL